MIVVESTVWIDILRGKQTPQTAWLQRHRDDREIALLDLVVCEVLQGLRRTEGYTQVRDSLFSYQILETGGADLAEASANHYRALRERGISIRSTIDCIIATYCIREGHILLHNDRDFDYFERHLGLKALRSQLA